MHPTLLALPPQVGCSTQKRWGLFFVTTSALCPVCVSANTAIGIAPGSTNVSQICNACNFRDVIYYGNSLADAFRWFKIAIAPRSTRPKCSRYSVRRNVPTMRSFSNFNSIQSRRRLGVSLSHVQLCLGQELNQVWYSQVAKVVVAVEKC